MRLRSKAITIVVLTTAVLLALLTAAFQLVVGRHFAQVEEADMVDRAALVRESVTQLGDFLDRKVTDWALWDDAYHYLEKPDQAWFEANVNPPWMRASAVNVCVFIDASGRVVGQRAFDLSRDQLMPVPASLLEVLAPPNLLTRMPATDDHARGLVVLPDGVLMVAARPSLDNAGKGPSHGVVLFGRWLDRTEQAAIARQVRAPVEIFTSAQPGDGRLTEARAALDAGVPVAVTGSDATATGHFRIPDLFGGDGVVVRVDRPRDAVAVGRNAVVTLLVVTAVATLLFGAVVLIALDRLVLARVARLGHEVEVAGQVAGVFTVIGDDEIARLAAAIQRMHAALAEANQAVGDARDQAVATARAKAEFLAGVSHEVRTPMNGVLGMTRLLLNTPLTDEQRELVEVLRTSGDNLLALVNDILDMSKIEAGKLELEAVPFSPGAVIEEAVVLLAERAQAKGLELAGVVESDVPNVVRGDPGRLRQIIVNLLANAVKFTERGEVVVRLSGVPGESDRNVMRLRLVVSDTGIGIPPAARDRLFERYSQAESSTFRRFGGTGLGLSICKHLAERMGGSISVDSVHGRGSTFTVQITLARCEGPSGKVALLPEVEVLSKRRILVIDDHTATREAIQRILRESGTEVEEAADLAGAGLLIASGQRYHAAIVDLGLLGSDAPTLSQLAIRLPALAGIPVLLALPLAAKERASAAAGFAASVSKPVRAAQLRAALARVLSKPAAAAVPAGDAVQPSAGLRVLVVDDSPINCRVATGMLGRLSCRCDTATNGQEALDALANADYDLVLLDCQMPVMDGYTAVTELRRREGARRHTRVIALTADATQGARDRCLAAGMDDYLMKPVQYDDLAAAVRRSRPSRSPDQHPAVTGAATTPAEALELDRELLDQVRILGDEGFRNVLDRYIEQGPQRLADLGAAFTSGDAKKVGAIAHQIVGESGLVGLRRVEVIARSIELAARSQGALLSDQLEPLRESFTRGAELLRGVRDADPAKT